jgi:hypothetical protein
MIALAIKNVWNQVLKCIGATRAGSDSKEISMDPWRIFGAFDENPIHIWVIHRLQQPLGLSNQKIGMYPNDPLVRSKPALT